MAFRAIFEFAAVTLLISACTGPPAYGPAFTQASALGRPLTPHHKHRQAIYVAGIYSSSGVLYGYSYPELRLIYSTLTSLNEPEGITADSSGAVYVANTYGYNIVK